MEMHPEYQLKNLEETIAHDRRFLFTIMSFVMIFLIYFNELLFKSIAIGAPASIVFFLINILYLGQALFGNEPPYIRFALGSLVFFLSLGIIGWGTLIVHNLDAVSTSAALFIVAILCSTINRLKRSRRRGNLE